MPNLNQIYSLKQKFHELSSTDIKVKNFIESSETKDTIKKAFESGRLNEDANQTKFFSFLNENLKVKPELIKHFEEGKEEDVALTFVDITSFSKTIKGWSNSQIKKYLDDYYKEIIPIIYKNGGEIEKVMGDGIIVVFGKPFLNLENPMYVYKAEEFAESVIKKFHGTDKNVKVAIHKGKVHYYKVPGEQYSEYTMIGQPITDLYRLESVAKSNAINFFGNSSYDNLGFQLSIFDQSAVYCHGFNISDLQGIDFTQVKYIKFPKYL